MHCAVFFRLRAGQTGKTVCRIRIVQAVPHYLRCAYKKLDMHNTSQIPWLLGLRDAPAASQSGA